MLHLKFMNFAMNLIHKASDGELTLEEVSDCMMEFAPDYFTEFHDAVEKAQQDGRISVMDAINIASSLVA